MKVSTEIDDDDLDTRHPDPEDAEGRPAQTNVMVSIRNADGMGHVGAVVHHGQATPEVVAEALVSALHGAARTHSPAAAAALRRWLVVPPDLKIVPGGEDT